MKVPEVLGNTYSSITTPANRALEHAVMDRMFPEWRDPVDPALLFRLTRYQLRIARHINISSNTKHTISTRSSSQAFAKALTQMAFLEGGLSEVRRTSSFMALRGLEVNIGKGSISNVLPTRDSIQPVKLTLCEDYIKPLRGEFSTSNLRPQNDVFHELVHVLQQTRSNQEEFVTHLDRRLKLTLLGATSSAISGAILLEGEAHPIFTGTVGIISGAGIFLW